MFRRLFFFLLIFITLVQLSPPALYAKEGKNNLKKEKKIDCILRLGEGGFRDSRSPAGSLGGGQLALDIKPRKYPIALSISSEYYTNSPAPSHSYEIEKLLCVNILYMDKLFKFKKLDYFLGGGFGRLQIPKEEEEKNNSPTKSNLYNLEAGIHFKAFWRIGLYAAFKHLNAQRRVNNIKVIDFNEKIVLIGFTFNFSL